MSRLIWLSNAPWCGSGYGEQTQLFVPRIGALGHEVAIAANFGLQGANMHWAGTQVYAANAGWGNPSISTFVKTHRADYVVALCDAWVMHPDQWADDVRMAIWAPVDHWPIPPKVYGVLNHPKVMPIAMSRYGRDEMRDRGLEPLYVPHGVDVSVFRPDPELRKVTRADVLPMPEDAFIVGMVGANKGNPLFPRKGFPQAFDAFSRFLRRHDDAFLYCHSRNGDSYTNGIDLEILATAVGIPQDRMAFTPDHAWDIDVMDRTFLAGLYNSFDVLLHPSWGEGFGVPLIEAQACGVPVIASEHSAMTELTNAGWLVRGDRFWDSLQASFAILPAISEIEDALEAAYEAREDTKLREKARAFALDYDADLVTVRDWEPVLKQVAEWVDTPREVPPLNGNKESRQVRRARERAKA